MRQETGMLDDRGVIVKVDEAKVGENIIKNG